MFPEGNFVDLGKPADLSMEIYCKQGRTGRGRAFQRYIPSAGRAGDPTSLPAPLSMPVEEGESIYFVPSSSPRLFRVVVRDSSERAACAAETEAYVEREAEGIRAKRGR